MRTCRAVLVLSAVLALRLLAAPVSAETPGHLLTEATQIAQGLEDNGDRSSALAAVVRSYGSGGDLPAAADLVLSEPDAAVRGPLWLALVDGVAQGAGPAAALEVLDALPDAGIRQAGLSLIGQAQVAAGDLAGAGATLGLIDDPAEADLLRLWLVDGFSRQGDMDAARALLGQFTNPDDRDRAALQVGGTLADAGDPEAGLAILQPLAGSRVGIQARAEIIRMLDMLGRQAEADALIASETDSATLALVWNDRAMTAAAGGDPDAAAALIARMPAPERHVLAGWDRITLMIARADGADAARAYLERQETPADADMTLVQAAWAAEAEGDLVMVRVLLMAVARPGVAEAGWISAVAMAAPGDPDRALADLARITTPRARFDAIVALLLHRYDPALEAEAVAFARSVDDPDLRVRLLARLAAAL